MRLLPLLASAAAAGWSRAAALGLQYDDFNWEVLDVATPEHPAAGPAAAAALSDADAAAEEVAAAAKAERPAAGGGEHPPRRRRFWGKLGQRTMDAGGKIVKAWFGNHLSEATDAAMGGNKIPTGQGVVDTALEDLAAAGALGVGTAAAAGPMAAGGALGGAMGAAAVGALLTPFAPLSIPLAAGAMTSAAAGAGASAVAGTLSAGATIAAGGAAKAGSHAVSHVIDMAKTRSSDPEALLSLEELVRSRGYPIEVHNTTTDDGYILTMFRIPHGHEGAAGAGAGAGSNGTNGTNGRGYTAHRPAVLLQHGLLDCAMSFVANFPDQALAYILADAGYDVWLGNNRGTAYSRSHTKWSPTQKEFWDFTWEEMAQYDLPTEVEYILRSTAASRVAYVCHSEGSTQAFAALAGSRRLASKLSVLVAMAPVAYVKNQRAPLLTALTKVGADRFVHRIGDGFYLLSTESLKSMAPVVCKLLPRGCNYVIDMMAGKSKHLNRSRIQFYSSWFPQGTSTKNLAHWANSVRAGTFARYDYGSAEKNWNHYGASEPPAYNLSKITTPLALFSGSLDQLADPKDVARLERELRPGVIFESVEVKGYAHTDFILAPDAKDLLYPQVMKALASHQP